MIYILGAPTVFALGEMPAMKNFFCTAIVALLAILHPAYADVAVPGKASPSFSLSNALGESVSLGSLQGKTVVLEWFNPECPFVKKFYRGGDMQKLQQEARAQGVAWLTISSSAQGKQGHISATDAASVAQQQNLDPKFLLLDSDGAVGKAFGARTTPHIFVIDPKGVVAYAGAIDSTPSTSSSDITSATNYARAAYQAIALGKSPPIASTEPYGCSVKY
jgi:peroxiredoxin